MVAYTPIRQWCAESNRIEKIESEYFFLNRNAVVSVAYAVMRCLFIRLSIAFVNSYPQTFFTIGEPNCSSFSVPNVMAVFRRGPPNGVIECRWGRHKSQFWTNSWLSIDCWTCEQQLVATDDQAVYCADGDASVNVCLSQTAAWTNMPKRRDENRI